MIVCGSPGYSSVARRSSIAFRSLTFPKLLSHKEWSVYLLDSLAQQVVYKRKSLTVDEANVFQIDGELQSHNSCDLQHSRMSLFDGSKSLSI